MSFFKKVASAFVVVEDDPAATPGADSAGAGLEEITKDTSTLLSQLEGRPTRTDGAAVGARAASSDGSTLEMTAEDVFAQEGLSDGPSSALRVLKLVAGLAMFPREQQLAMVRAMDAADDSWAESDVVQDAQQRQGVLRAHLASIAQERAQQMSGLVTDIEQTRKSGESVLQEIDQRIAELYARREKEAAATAAAVAKLEQLQRELENRETRARQGIAQVIQALGGLLAFLGIAQGPQSPQ